MRLLGEDEMEHTSNVTFSTSLREGRTPQNRWVFVFIKHIHAFNFFKWAMVWLSDTNLLQNLSVFGVGYSRKHWRVSERKQLWKNLMCNIRLDLIRPIIHLKQWKKRGNYSLHALDWITFVALFIVINTQKTMQWLYLHLIIQFLYYSCLNASVN